MRSGERYRVVQWATGNIGLRSLRAVIDHPDLDLVGLYVYSEDKAGRDAGELCGTDPTGVLATRDIGDILALEPDCVLYMGDRADIDVSFGSNEGGDPGSDRFNADAQLAALEELAQLGVTWSGVGVPGDSLDHAVEALERFGKSVIR